MRIAIVQDHLRNGGTERQSVFLARHFLRRGHRVTVVCFRPGGVLFDTLSEAGVPLHVLQPWDTHLNFWAPRLSRCLRELDVEIVLCMGRMANAYVHKLAKALPEASIMGSVRTGKPLPWHNARALRNASGIVVNSDWWAKTLQDYGINPIQVAVIYNSLTREWKQRDGESERRTIRARKGAEDNDCVYVNVAEMRPGKRHDWLIERFAELPNPRAQLWIVGGGVQASYCKGVADRLGVGSRVKFAGYVDDPYAWLVGADVAVSASLEDAQPNFLVEAQSVGLPCVAVDYRGVRECFSPDVSGLCVAPDDATGFVNALQRLAENAELRRDFSIRACEYAAAYFDAERNADAYLEFFSKELDHQNV